MAAWPFSTVGSALFSQAPPSLETATMDPTTTPITTTHDTTSASSHLPDFPSLLSHLSDAVAAASTNASEATKYQNVKALFLSWDKDDLDVASQMAPLIALLKGVYHYDTDAWKIPSRRTAAELYRKLTEFVKANGQEGNLLIIYYGGHAKANERAVGGSTWFAKYVFDPTSSLRSPVLTPFPAENASLPSWSHPSSTPSSATPRATCC